MKVRVRNYQSIKDTTVDVKGFTVVVGKSNTGKTALLRAVEGAIFNDSVRGRVRYGEKTSVVDIQYRDIAWTWEKGEGANDYMVTTPDGTEDYSRVGFKVPDEIVDRGFKEWWVDNVKARPQIAQWHEPIFLLNKTGKVITELMATVTRLDVVNMAIRKCGLYTKRKRSTLKVREQDLQKAEKRAREFDVLDDIDVAGLTTAHTAYTGTKDAIDTVDTYTVRLGNLKGILDDYKVLDDLDVPEAIPTDTLTEIGRVGQWDQKHDTYRTTLDQLDVLDSVDIPDINLQASFEELSQIGGWVGKLENYAEMQTFLDTLDSIEIPEVNLQCTLDGLANVDDYITRLLDVGGKLKKVKQDLEQLDKDIEHDELHLDEVRGEIDECPVCGRDG